VGRVLTVLAAVRDDVLTPDGAAKVLGVCSKTVLAWHRNHRLPPTALAPSGAPAFRTRDLGRSRDVSARRAHAAQAPQLVLQHGAAPSSGTQTYGRWYSKRKNRPAH